MVLYAMLDKTGLKNMVITDVTCS